MFLTALSLLIIQDSALKCPVMQTSNAGQTSRLEYAGTSYGFCCAGCDTKFKAEPKKYIAQAAKAKTTIGEFLFDPVTGMTITQKKAKASTDYMGTRFYFSSADNKEAFLNDSKKFGTVPKYESLVCPVMKTPIASYAKANGYVDFENTRYYLCCAGCDLKMKKSPATYAKNVKAAEPKAIAPVK